MKHQRLICLSIIGVVISTTCLAFVFGSSSTRRVTTASAQNPVRVLGETIQAPPTPPPSGYVYLTFDDGPNPTFTPQILGLLNDYHARATFFSVGLFVDRFRNVSHSLSVAGNSVQNHTYDHHALTEISPDFFHYEIARTQDAVTNATGITPKCVRPPYDAVNPSVVSGVNAMNLQLEGWTVDSEDWQKPGIDAIVRNVLTYTVPNSVILMHDGGGDRSETAAALGEILPVLIAHGYGFGVLCT